MKRQTPPLFLIGKMLISSAMVLAVAACGMQPEAPERYNTVNGQKRPPLLNPGGKGLGPTINGQRVVSAAQETTEFDRRMAQEQSGMYDQMSGTVNTSQALQQHASLPRKQPIQQAGAPHMNPQADPYDTQYNMAVPVEPVMDDGMIPVIPEASQEEIMMEMPVEEMATAPVYQPQPALDEAGYPVLAETPPSPVENMEARLEAAEQDRYTLEKQRAEAMEFQQQDHGEGDLRAALEAAAGLAPNSQPVETAVPMPPSEQVSGLGASSVPASNERVTIINPLEEEQSHSHTYQPIDASAAPVFEAVAEPMEVVGEYEADQVSGVEMMAPEPVPIQLSPAPEPIQLTSPSMYVEKEPIQLTPPSASGSNGYRGAYLPPSRYAHRRGR